MSSKRFEVRKDNLSHTRVETVLMPAPGADEILLQVERFALTANNITYGVTGDTIGYWHFFPAADGWGIIPVWGFARVVESRCEDIAVGERLYGYLPMASHLVVKPARVSTGGFVDASEHRNALPAVYNGYARTVNEPHYDAAMDNERMLLFPLYATSFCLADYLADNDYFAATQVIVPSASSKTAIGFADALVADKAPLRRIGLTSSGHVEQVKALGLYDEVFAYDELNRVDAGIPAVVVDMSGHGAVLSQLHGLLGDNMRLTAKVGLTHYEDTSPGPEFIKERSRFFFAPSHIAKRREDWGPGEFEKRAYAFWHGAAVRSRQWLNIESCLGLEKAEPVYQQLLDGKVSPNVGLVVVV